MTKLLVFGASNSKNSINKSFAEYAANRLDSVQVKLVDLNDYASPLYSIDLEVEHGVDPNALRFFELIQEADGIVASMAEYNGLHTSAFKNLWDWLSRIPKLEPMNIWGNKPMFLLSTSPSKRPSNNVLKISKELFPHFGAHIVADFYLPSFNHFFKNNEITEEQYAQAFQTQLDLFQTYLNKIN